MPIVTDLVRTTRGKEIKLDNGVHCTWEKIAPGCLKLTVVGGQGVYYLMRGTIRGRLAGAVAYIDLPEGDRRIGLMVLEYIRDKTGNHTLDGVSMEMLGEAVSVIGNDLYQDSKDVSKDDKVAEGKEKA